MQHGIDTEPQAAPHTASIATPRSTEVGFVEHPTIAMSGCSPDGLVGEVGMVEIKCPNTATHLDTLLGEADPRQIRHADAMADGLHRPAVVRLRFLRSAPAGIHATVRRSACRATTRRSLHAEGEVITFL
jgi:hypothetical protein